MMSSDPPRPRRPVSQGSPPKGTNQTGGGTRSRRASSARKRRGSDHSNSTSTPAGSGLTRPTPHSGLVTCRTNCMRCLPRERSAPCRARERETRPDPRLLTPPYPAPEDPSKLLRAGSRARNPRRRHPSARHPPSTEAAARSEGRGSPGATRSHAQPPRGEHVEDREERPCPERARRQPRAVTGPRTRYASSCSNCSPTPLVAPDSIASSRAWSSHAVGRNCEARSCSPFFEQSTPANSGNRSEPGSSPLPCPAGRGVVALPRPGARQRRPGVVPDRPGCSPWLRRGTALGAGHAGWSRRDDGRGA